MHPDSLERIRDHLANRTSKSGKVRGNGLANMLAKSLGLSLAETRLALNVLHEKGELLAKDWHTQLGPEGMVTLALDLPENPSIKIWMDSMDAAGLNGQDQSTLRTLADTLSVFGSSDQKEIARSLLKMRDSQADRRGGSRYLTSAQYLLGSSKLLDALPKAPLKAFGIDAGLLEGPPGYIVTAGPTQPHCVVLVENPQAMELALSTSGVDDVAWIATFGYGLSRRGSEQGKQLASLIEGSRPSLHSVIRAGHPPPLPELFAHKRIFFWGDLDPEGLRIYWRLKAQISQLQLSALYEPMIELLKSDSSSHPYVNCVGKENQQVWKCDDVEVFKLLELCKKRGVDQEAVNSEQIREYSTRPLITECSGRQGAVFLQRGYGESGKIGGSDFAEGS